MAATVAVAVTTRWWFIVVAVAVVLAVGRAPRLGLAALALSSAGIVRSDSAWQAVRPDTLGPFVGWATVTGDPQVLPGATRVVLTIEGERFESWVRGRVRRQRAASWRAGDRVMVAGERDDLGASRRRRVASQHIVGALDADWFGDAVPGDRLGDASNRVRAVIARGAGHLPPDHAALARGLVIGDDRDEPAAMVQRFRDAGLSHLTAVSGKSAQ